MFFNNSFRIEFYQPQNSFSLPFRFYNFGFEKFSSQKTLRVLLRLIKHLSHKCLKVTNKQENKTVLKTKNLCYICLELGHVAKFCSLSYFCQKV